MVSAMATRLMKMPGTLIHSYCNYLITFVMFISQKINKLLVKLNSAIVVVSLPTLSQSNSINDD